MERERKEKAKNRTAAIPARALSRKTTPLMELEWNERKGKERKGKERKGKEKKGKTKWEKAEKEKAEKEKAEKEIAEKKKADPYYSPNRACHICVTRDHWTTLCPNNIMLQPDAFVGPYAQIVCLCCGVINPQRAHPGKPGVDWPARAILRPTPGDVYPSIEKQLKELNMGAAARPEHQRKRIGGHNTSASEGAAYGTGKARGGKA